MATTGGVYRFLRGAFGVDKTKIKWLLYLHSLDYLPTWLGVTLLLIVFIAIFSVIFTGTRMLIRRGIAVITRRRSSFSYAALDSPKPTTRISTINEVDE
eukprot:gene16747-19913_t